MKHRPLTLQIWTVLASVTLGLSILVIIFIFFTLRSFFMNETYRMIENAQTNQLNEQVLSGNPIEQDRARQTNRGVNHVVLVKEVGLANKTALPHVLIEKMYDEAFNQDRPSARYTKDIAGERIYYVIQLGEFDGKDVALVSYMWDSYLNDLVKTLFKQLLVVIFGAMMLIVLPAAALAQYVTKPLRKMEKHVKRIAEKDWHEPLENERDDEIGNLARSIEKMRKKLVHQDEAQKSMLQHISHELKTPVMVIRSYAESIEDGVFPKGDLQGSIHVIQEEAERLEKRVKDLLYLTRLDYFSSRAPQSETFSLLQLLEDVKERLRPNRPEINIILEGDDLLSRGDHDQWTVAFENIIDNQLRYAETIIRIQLGKKQVRIWNDGPPIEENMRRKLFETFQTGKNGKFGLGLAIVKRIAELHQARVYVENEEGGAAFYISLYGNSAGDSE